MTQTIYTYKHRQFTQTNKDMTQTNKKTETFLIKEH
jgi:hypothetical protein